MGEAAKVIVTTAGELEELLERVVAKALAKQPDNSAAITLSLAEVAKYFGKAERTVRRLVADKGLPVMRFGHELRFDKAAVIAWAAARKDEGRGRI